MSPKEAKEKVLSAFEPTTQYYSQVLPVSYNDFIDGMAWVGILCGACYLAHKKTGEKILLDIAKKSEAFLKRLLLVGPDARNFAPEQVSPDWVESKELSGYWYSKKPQSFAGPAGLCFAIDNGAELSTTFNAKRKAKTFVAFGWIFGLVLKSPVLAAFPLITTSIGACLLFKSFIPGAIGLLLVGAVAWGYKGLRQHINSMFLSYLILGKKPASTLLWLCADNPFYSYIAGLKCETEYPDPSRVSEGKSEESDEIVLLKDRKPSSWIFRSWPKTRYIRSGTPVKTYTPIWQVVGDCLQSTL